MTRSSLRASAVLVLLCLFPVPAGAQGRATPAPPANELDAFMERVLERREINRQMLQQYVLDEHEQFEVLGPSRMPIYRQRRDFTWYVRDGLHVRSPVKFDGVSVGDAARQEYEDRWSKRERARLEQERKKKEGKDTKETQDAAPEPDALPDDPAGLGASPIPTPRFVSEAYFLDFKFEPGNYYLVGREQLEGKTVLRIEHYPTRMFSDDDSRGAERDRNRRSRGDERAKREGERIERQMNKTALVTIWVDPAEHQIVRYHFENVWMDFLPGKWLVRVDDIKASMTMGQPFPDVWLPREMNIHAGVTIAAGALEAAYDRRFANYKLAETKTIIRIPKRNPQDGDSEVYFPEPDRQPAAAVPEVVSEVRVHGNAYLRDDEVVRLSGVKLGQALEPDAVQQIKQRLEKSGYFETVEIKKGYRSLEIGGDVSLLLIVHERPGQTTGLAGDGPSTTPWKRLKSRLMFQPIVDYTDGYGFTYGGRISTVRLLGRSGRLSTPLTWGGTRRAAVEVERTFERGPLSRVETTVGITQRENPRFEIDDRRVAWTARAERTFAGLVRAGVGTSRSAVAFAALDHRLWTVGADVTLDTRGDPAFPRNAVLLGTSWTRLNVSPGAGAGGRATDHINRYTTDARGYLGVVGQAVVAGRVLYTTADRTLPPYERLLLGGSSTLRGFAPGTYDGDRLLATSAELRVPVTSVLSGAKLGVMAFVDAAKTFDVGQRASDAEWHRGVGGGVFLIATIVRINLGVAHGLKDGDTRVHLAMGFGF